MRSVHIRRLHRTSGAIDGAASREAHGHYLCCVWFNCRRGCRCPRSKGTRGTSGHNYHFAPPTFTSCYPCLRTSRNRIQAASMGGVPHARQQRQKLPSGSVERAGSTGWFTLPPTTCVSIWRIDSQSNLEQYAFENRWQGTILVSSRSEENINT